ncbi:MAG TPA: methionine--tRNA ligase [Patescibacteria group bacterium]|nr:methionine--tRNA ligase [Patescibacteria group bacterium]
MSKFYITNSIPYVNAEPHIGHALEFIQSDVINRYQRLLGKNVYYLCGSDENAIKNVQAAEKAGKPIQEFIDQHAGEFQKLAEKLNIHFDVFQKGSSENHHKASQKLWDLCNKSGDIYKKAYTGLYCVGCEEFKTKSELNDKGECNEHPGKQLEEVAEENYFFRLSKYQDFLLKLIASNEYQIVPDFRKNEIIAFIKSGLEDFSISRSNQRAKNWGVPIPGDPTQRIYVWFDALNIYQSGIGFGSDEKTYEKWWPADLHVVGKGIIRFHAVYWPAILHSAGLATPKKLFVHEYFTVNGQKMSKTLGNVVNPLDMIERYGTDALRYYCLAKISPFQDGDFSEEKLKEAYNSDLANGLGNLVARVAKLAENNDYNANTSNPEISQTVRAFLESFEFNRALEAIWLIVKEADQYINEKEPWKLSEKEEISNILHTSIDLIKTIGVNLQPFLPETAEKILTQFSGEITSNTPLFPRIS